MAMSWTDAFTAQDNSLEAMLARQAIQQKGTLSVANALEERRQAAEGERLRQQQLDEDHLERMEAIKTAREQKKADLEFRRQAQESLDEQRRAAAVKLEADAKRDRLAEIDRANQGVLNRSIALAVLKDRQGDQNRTEARFADDPKLPFGVQQYIMSLPKKVRSEQRAGADGTMKDFAVTGPTGGNIPYSYEDAVADLSSNWGKLTGAHENLDMNRVLAATKQLFTQPADDRQLQLSGGTGTRKVVGPDGVERDIPESMVEEALSRGGKLVNAQ